MKNNLYVFVISLLLSCSSSRNAMVVDAVTNRCRLIPQDFSIDSSVLRNVYNSYQDFIASSNEIDLLKISVREEGRSNVFKRIYSNVGGSQTGVLHYSNKEEQVTNHNSIDSVHAMSFIVHGKYTYFCLNELPSNICFYFVKVHGEVVYKLMISEGREIEMSQKDSVLTSLFKLLEY